MPEVINTKKAKKIEAIKAFLLPAYEFRLDYLEKEQEKLRKELQLNTVEIDRVKGLYENVSHNLGRATAEDLEGVMFVFTGSTTP